MAALPSLPDGGVQALYRVAQLRDVEQKAQAALSPHVLMTRAGRAATAAALTLGEMAVTIRPASGKPRILIAAGPGNNGGDALECAANLAQRGCDVTLLMPQAPLHPGTDYALALARAIAAGVPMLDAAALAQLCTRDWDLVIDGLFGIGLTRPLDRIWQTVITALNRIDAPLLALDVPSGLNADTGAVLPGADGERTCVRATRTITFIADKPGLHTAAGRDQAGTVEVARIGIDPCLLPKAVAFLNAPTLFRASLAPRHHDSHKGSYGDVQIIGGATGMAGAAILAAHAALKAGSGRVLIGFIDRHDRPAVIAGHPELMCRSAAELDPAHATVVIGPGLGCNDQGRMHLERMLASDSPLVIDADALNLIAATPACQQLLAARAGRGAPSLLTPHPLEAARLLGMSTAQVQADRLTAAVSLATRFQATVILKGSGTVIADGVRLVVNPTGNPALASGGTGDVLAGLCGALLAQGWPLPEAALGAVWIHGAAADQLVADGIGPIGVTASEIVDASRAVLNRLVNQQRPAGAGALAG